MRKVRICAPNIWVNSNENLGFAPPVFWPYVIDCAPNLQQVLPPLLGGFCNRISFIYRTNQQLKHKNKDYKEYVP